MTDPLSLRVAARWQHRGLVSRVAGRHVADQAPGQREHVRDLAQPINKPRGITKEITKDYAESKTEGEDTATPHRRDIQPEDVFSPTPKNTGVLNLVKTDKDLSKPLEKQVPKDKGYETVRQLSQYLIRTEGGAEGGPEGKNL